MSSGFDCGFRCSRSAAAPLPCGAAKLVPTPHGPTLPLCRTLVSVSVSPPPMATRCGRVSLPTIPRLLYDATFFPSSVVAPTMITPVASAGVVSVFGAGPLLPALLTMISPSDHAVLQAFASREVPSVAGPAPHEQLAM